MPVSEHHRSRDLHVLPRSSPHRAWSLFSRSFRLVSRSVPHFTSKDKSCHSNKQRQTNKMSTTASRVRRVYSNGIYHGLPVIDEDHAGLSAIVVGASGMSGQLMVDQLVQTPKRWKKVWALSRRPPQSSAGAPGVAHHVPTDLLKEPDEIAASLKQHGVEA